jgi:hypothetical protein
VSKKKKDDAPAPADDDAQGDWAAFRAPEDA